MKRTRTPARISPSHGRWHSSRTPCTMRSERMWKTEMIQINPADFGEEYQRIVALLTAVLSGDKQTTADIAQEIAGDTGAVLHLAAFAATQIECLGAECGI